MRLFRDSWEHAVRDYPEVFQAGRNYADAQIHDRNLSPKSIWDLEWRGLSKRAYAQFASLGLGPTPSLWSPSGVQKAFTQGFVAGCTDFADPDPPLSQFLWWMTSG